ncbi:MAG TPA: SUMF1/EgtB/PvdO family nonheme iron enzyme [Chthonomonadaceae bacterium]|nr:SUMF1/EgtB/PvdO family nonheme iron enzyme [Chthonomonadaceae bacterium]
MSQAARKAALKRDLEQTRKKTLGLLDFVPDAFLKVRVHDFYSPIGWHFGHIGMTEEHWVCTRALGRPGLSDSLSFLFANLPENPKDNRIHLPSRAEIIAYLAETRCRALQALDETDLDSHDPLIADGYAWEFAWQHECQHQETITELLQLIHSVQSAQADFAPAEWRFRAGATLTEMVSIPGGTFLMGSEDRHGYDNEKRAHPVEVAPFEMDRTPVMAAQWLAFMEAGGYENAALWREEGYCGWVLPNQVSAPEYWRKASGAESGYGYIAPTGPRPLDPEEPVCGISWYEADAYARWAGKRLPTEAEWEYAAAYDPDTGQTRRYPWGAEAPQKCHASFGLADWKPAPVGRHPAGASAFGLQDMAGGVWEWTSTPFLPYPGFTAFPYDGYSKEYMDGSHLVCRGGSWATAGRLLRCSFRNWYVPTYRLGLLGLRCAR